MKNYRGEENRYSTVYHYSDSLDFDRLRRGFRFPGGGHDLRRYRGA